MIMTRLEGDKIQASQALSEVAGAADVCGPGPKGAVLSVDKSYNDLSGFALTLTLVFVR